MRAIKVAPLGLMVSQRGASAAPPKRSVHFARLRIQSQKNLLLCSAARLCVHFAVSPLTILGDIIAPDVGFVEYPHLQIAGYSTALSPTIPSLSLDIPTFIRISIMAVPLNITFSFSPDHSVVPRQCISHDRSTNSHTGNASKTLYNIHNHRSEFLHPGDLIRVKPTRWLTVM
jgi:hypothetical protein